MFHSGDHYGSPLIIHICPDCHGSNLGSSSVEDSNESLTFDDVNIEIDFDVKLIM